MPNCFSLTRKSNPEAGPVYLNIIDEEMCKHFGVRVNEKRYYMEWYCTIGFALACGKTFEEIRQVERKILSNALTVNDEADAHKRIAVVDWLDENFTANAWAER